MSRPQEAFSKKEKEKKRLKKRQEKLLKKQERKANKGQASEFSYVDENGHLTDTPPDPTKKMEVDVESIQIGVPKRAAEEPVSAIRKGVVEFFNDSKGYGFIKEKDTNEKYFVHISGVIDEIKENNMVTFELERGMKGMNAVKVKKA